MGLPLDAARSATDRRTGREFIEAPLRLQTESYESFSSRLLQHLGEDAAAERAGVDEELRRLEIDPEVFYRNAKRLGVQKFSPDDLDPTSAPGATTTPARAGSVETEVSGGSVGTAGAVPGAQPAEPMGDTLESTPSPPFFAPPPRGEELAAYLTTPEKASDGKAGGGGQGRSQGTADLHHIATDADALHESGVLKLTQLNVPDDIEDLAYEEISLGGDEAGETRGGRLGRETPRGMTAKLQIDTLTDDEDEGCLRPSADPPIGADAAAADSEDEVEAFSLDPDFDYDKVDNLTSRFPLPG